jgi:hypothetical protein
VLITRVQLFPTKPPSVGVPITTVNSESVLL